MALDLKNFQWKRGYWGILGGVVLAGVVGSHLYNQAQLLSKTCIKPAGFVPNTLTATSADINIKLALNNKSNIEYYLQNQVYNVYINDIFVGTIQNPNKIYVAPMRSTDVWLNVKFNPMQLVNLSWTTLKDLLIQNSNISIQLQGNAKITTGAGLLSYNYPVDTTFTLADLSSNSNSEPC